jgi:hypothetical protein
MDPDPTPDPTPFFIDFKDAKKIYLAFSFHILFLITSSSVLKIKVFAKILC